MASALWAYRGFILGSVKREFQSRYLGSLLGRTWAIFNPLAMIIVYTVIFAQIMKTRLPGIEDTFSYSIYLMSGLLPWGLLAEILSRSQSVFVENGNLIKKANFPRGTLPIVTLITASINFSIVFILFMVVLVITANFPGIAILGILPVLMIQIVFAGGLGILLSTLNVFFRDIGQMIGVLLTLWFWFTPIVYPISIVPDKAKSLLELNPMTPLITAYRDICLYHHMPHWETLIPVTLLSAFVLWFGITVFKANAGEIADEL
jgi:lipopolysaccharide transport system permease protein